VRLFVCVLVSLVFAGCGARGPWKVDVDAPHKGDPKASSDPALAAPPSFSLAEFIAKARVVASEARPADRPALEQVEASDPRLREAIAAVQLAPSPQTLRRVSQEYQRLGIADRAHQYLRQALQMDPSDAATYDALARLWRDGGLTGLALSDAHRAVYYAPASATAHNTLGTVFQALGRRTDARKQYERALQLDPSAAYALNNLCYGWILEDQPAKAVAACQAALKLNPSLSAARNNLGLAYAVRGDLDASRGAFEHVGDRATALYNLGIVYMARRQYPDAVSAFAAAQQARPSFRLAAERAHQAGELARAGTD
jgi:Flp pilus assembly protein TadD